MLRNKRKFVVGIIIAVSLAIGISAFAMAAGPTNSNGNRYNGANCPNEDCPNSVNCYPCDGVCDNVCPQDYCPNYQICDRPCAKR